MYKQLCKVIKISVRGIVFLITQNHDQTLLVVSVVSSSSSAFMTLMLSLCLEGVGLVLNLLACLRIQTFAVLLEGTSDFFFLNCPKGLLQILTYLLTPLLKKYLKLQCLLCNQEELELQDWEKF